MYIVQDVYDYIDSIAPFSSQMQGDNAGFLVGDGNAKLSSVLLALDITPEVIEEAVRLGANLIVSHHPIIFHPLRVLKRGDIAYLAAQSGISMICAHTNLDLAEGGVNDALAKALELQNVRKAGDSPSFIRVGELPKVAECNQFIKYIGEKLGCGGIKYTSVKKQINTVALCAGSGGDEYSYAIKAGADAYVTANIKHNIFIDARRENLCIVDAGHFSTENVVIMPLAEKLREAFPALQVTASKESRDPADYWLAESRD